MHLASVEGHLRVNIVAFHCLSLLHLSSSMRLCFFCCLHIRSQSELSCLRRLSEVDVYTGVGWKKKFKAPSEFGFALKVFLAFLSFSDFINSPIDRLTHALYSLLFFVYGLIFKFLHFMFNVQMFEINFDLLIINC